MPHLELYIMKICISIPDCELKLLFPAYPTLNSRIENTVELNGCPLKSGDCWNDVEIGHYSL